jgi:hypothetical protein
MTYSQYSGQRGDDYTATETYTETDSDGNTQTKTRTVVHTRWTWVSGEVQHFFDDVLVCASKGMPDDLVMTLEPWDLGKLEVFRPDYLSGFKTERYAVGLTAGFERAKQLMRPTIERLVCEDIGGDHQRIDSLQTRHLGVTFKHLLLPIWLASYRYRNELYQIMVNARTGEVVGRRPYSVAKIVSLVLAIILAAGLVCFIVAKAHGGQRPRGRPRADVVAPADGRAGGRFASVAPHPWGSGQNRVAHDAAANPALGRSRVSTAVNQYC